MKTRGIAAALAVLGLVLSPGLALGSLPRLYASDVQISNTPGNEDFDASDAEVAYGSADDVFLVVWRADFNIVNNEEIFARLVDGDGNPLGAQQQVSAQDSSDPAVAYNSSDEEFVVVWQGGIEIFARRVAINGNPLGLPVSISGTEARRPHIAYNPTDNEYLVVWESGDVQGETEVHGQQLGANLQELGTNDFRISDQGPPGLTTYGVSQPAVAYNAEDDEYFVVWSGDRIPTEDEIYGRFVSGGGLPQATPFKITQQGSDGDLAVDAREPDLVYNPDDDEYFLVWEGGAFPGFLDTDIFGQRLSPSGTGLGADFRISQSGNPSAGDTLDGRDPNVSYDRFAGEYLVVWAEEVQSSTRQISGRRVAAGGGTIQGEFEVSEPPGQLDISQRKPAVAFGTVVAQHLVAWPSDNQSPGAREIFGQILVPEPGARALGLAALVSLAGAARRRRPIAAFSPVLRTAAHEFPPCHTLSASQGISR